MSTEHFGIFRLYARRQENLERTAKTRESMTAMDERTKTIHRFALLLIFAGVAVIGILFALHHPVPTKWTNAFLLICLLYGFAVTIWRYFRGDKPYV